jgi:phosphomannomutase
MLNGAIFKAYDVRGIYPSELDTDSACAIGHGFARVLEASAAGPVVVGQDMRCSSGALSNALKVGLFAAGKEVIDIGLCTTPMLYFAVNTLSAAGGAMITASHNPAQYNGFKFVRNRAIPLGWGSGLEAIQREALRTPRWKFRRSFQRVVQPIDAQYTEFFVKRFVDLKSVPLVIDCGNGATGAILPQVLRALEIAYDGLYFEPDGRFPNHDANPLKQENLEDLRQVVLSHEDAIGVAFDGDGDRVAFVDERGQSVRGDLITALLAEHMLEEQESSPILYDLRSSHAVPEAITNAGGHPVRMRVGHAFMKQAMRENDALFGGELSFHYYFKDFFYCESGILAMLEVLRVLAEKGTSLWDAVAPFRKYAHSGEINYHVVDKTSCIARISETFQANEQDTLDGLTVQFPEWWFNLRTSNTEPLLRLNLEAASESLMDEKRLMVEQLIIEGGGSVESTD